MRMRKRTVTALMLTAALVLAPVSGELSMTARAAEDTALGGEATAASVSGGDAAGNGSEEGSGKTQLAVPTGLEWGEKGNITWNAVEAAEGYYYIQLYKDGNRLTGTSGLIGRNESDGMISYDNLRKEITESGAYQFRVQSLATYDPDSYEDSEWSELSSAYNYVKPDAVLGSVTCYWSDTEPGTLCWQEVEGAAGYEVKIYQYQDPGERRMGSSTSYYPGRTSTDMTHFFERYGAGRYRCTVRALSGDIEAIANGAEGGFSEYYDTAAAADSISGIISSAMENTAAGEALETIKANIDKTTLRTAMQTDDTVMNQIKALESAYSGEQGITVKAPAVSEEAGAYVKADAISVVGAGLNAAAGQEVGLEVSVPAQKEYVPNQHYANSVQLDIQLKRGAESVHELDIPVTITLPVPEGLDAGRLVILHYREDGSFETVNFRTSGDRMITFTVSRFSSFAFAEQIAEGGETDNDQPEDDGDSSDIGHAAVNVDWDNVSGSVDAAVKAANGQNIDILAGTSFTVPASVVSKLAGKRVTLALQTGNGLAFSITGANVKKAGELKITMISAESIPEAARQQVLTGAAFSRMFAMEEKSSYPFRVNVHLSVGEENAGKQAYLYYYDEASGRMRLAGAFTVTAGGQTMFSISRGDEYIVVVGQKLGAVGSYVVVAGDTLSGIAARSGIGLQKLLSLNPQISDMNKIYPNQVINVR